jgi:uncharacterized heparinase superfamily protein
MELSSLAWLDANRKAATALVHSLTSPATTFPPRISGLAIPIRPLSAGNPETGRRIYHGEFRFAGKSVFCRGAPIFEAASPGKTWLESLHGFAWLAHLEATGLELARVNAKALVSDWIERDRSHPHLAKALPILSRRLIAWITAAPFLLEHSGEHFLSRFCSGLTDHIRDLQLHSMFCISPARSLDCVIALAYAAVALKGMEAARPAALEQLGEKLERQILPDGGPASRNPAELARLLVDILPLRCACEEARIGLPAKLASAIERMLPMLRFFLHGDGGLATFQGVADPLAAQCSAILAADVTQGKPLSNASYSGYMRLSRGSSLVICDTGLTSQSASPAPLAFELSEDSSRIVVNCGAALDRDSPSGFEAETLSTATVVAYAKQAALPLPSLLAAWFHRSPRIEANLVSTSAGCLIEARHDAYASRAGVIHERCLFLSSAGTDFRGEDRFLPVADNIGAVRFLIRFHLHASVRAELAEDGSCISLKLPGDAAWMFRVRGAEISLTVSIPRKSKQIVLTGLVGPSPIQWAFKRMRHSL